MFIRYCYFNVYSPGQKYTRVRKILEQEIILTLGSKKNMSNYYQYIGSLGVETICYSSLYSRNVERDIGLTNFRHSQISVQLLWKITSNEGGSSFIFFMNFLNLFVFRCITEFRRYRYQILYFIIG